MCLNVVLERGWLKVQKTNKNNYEDEKKIINKFIYLLLAFGFKCPVLLLFSERLIHDADVYFNRQVVLAKGTSTPNLPTFSFE